MKDALEMAVLTTVSHPNIIQVSHLPLYLWLLQWRCCLASVAVACLVWSCGAVCSGSPLNHGRNVMGCCHSWLLLRCQSHQPCLSFYLPSCIGCQHACSSPSTHPVATTQVYNCFTDMVEDASGTNQPMTEGRINVRFRRLQADEDRSLATCNILVSVICQQPVMRSSAWA